MLEGKAHVSAATPRRQRGTGRLGGAAVLDPDAPGVKGPLRLGVAILLRKAEISAKKVQS